MSKQSMSLGFSNQQAQQQKQQLKLTPSLKQSIEIIQMTSLQLDQWLDQKIQENPFLIELEEEISTTGSLLDNDVSEIDNHTEINESSFLDDDLNQEIVEKDDWQDISYSATFDNDDSQHQVAAPVSFQNELEWQLLRKNLSSDLLVAAKFIIGNLDDDGLLHESLDALIDPLVVSEPTERLMLLNLFEDALKIVKSLDPVGVGASSFLEFLCLQLKSLDRPVQVKELAEFLLKEYSLKELAKPNFDVLSKSCGVEIHDIKAALALIKSLDPKIVSRLVSSDDSGHVSIDLKSYKKNGIWFVLLNQQSLKQVLFNSSYRDLLHQKNSFAAQWQTQAKQIVYQVQQRHSTLLRVGLEIAKRQQRFFEYGARGLLPMVLKDIATELEMNESTISRLVNGKYLQTPHGVIELKRLFSTGFISENNASQTEQEEVSSNTVKSLIQDLLRGEDQKKPYSDQKVSEWLKSDHRLDVARRTVAKYRDAMGIPAASERKN